jgi:hypothetical protein
MMGLWAYTVVLLVDAHRSGGNLGLRWFISCAGGIVAIAAVVRAIRFKEPTEAP